MVQQPSYWKVLTRRKILSTEGHETETKLNRVLGLYDLTALGVGSTLGAGVYVLAGQIAKEQAGPSVMLSFAIAALASLLAGVCYAEFGARVPKAGSAYVYSYVCIGEFAAFVIGWNLILEYVIGTAAVCRGISVYLDTLINDTLKTTFAEVSPINVSFLGSYFDWFAFGLVVVFGVALAFGVETSALANNFCTCLNISILLFVIIAGSIKANFSNWSIDVSNVNATEVNSDLGSGGFFPFGFSGTLRGAATCFFGFVGFDCIATTGEEVQNPRKNIPRSILLSLLVIFLCYFGVSTVLTLMVPYYNQDPNAPLPYAFKEVGWTFAMWIVSVGGLVGLLASLFGALFPLPRVMYSMAEDGLLFHFLGKISPRFQVPVIGSIFAAIMTALIAGLFDLNQLVNLLSIGTLLAYSVVAISVTILRYMDNTTENLTRTNGTLNGTSSSGNGASQETITETTMLTSNETRVTFSSVMLQIFNCNRLKTPNTLSTRIVGTLITLFCLLSVGIGLIFMEAYDALINNQVWVLVVLIILIIFTLIVLLAICLQPREIFTPRIKVFRVPFVPIVPAVSIFINIYLMLQLDVMTWIRFGIWMAIGIPLFIACYCMYDLKNPVNRSPSRIAYEKALKASAHGELDNMDNYDNNNLIGNGNLENGEILKENVKTLNGGNNNLAQQNQMTLKSLDEIVNMSDVSDDLIEMRHPNGKVFYIEDNRSNTSTATLERNYNGENGENIGDANNNHYNHHHHHNNNKAEATDEEKSVIALLDDVLQNEDDNNILSQHQTLNSINNDDYSRKFSVDSEMLPSVIETTIIATIHNSSSDSSKSCSDDVPEDNEESTTTTSYLGPFKNFEYQNECQELAKNLIDEIFQSKEIQKLLKENAEKLEKLEKLENEKEILTVEPSPVIVSAKNEILTQQQQQQQPTSTLPRKISEASILSTQSIEDPMHSARFKEKLSKIILQPPMPSVNNLKNETKNQIPNDVITNDSPQSPPPLRPKLKHSKSEADVRKLLLKSIENSNMKLKENNNDDDDVGVDNSSLNNNISVSTSSTDNNIPKAPKFDPVLYKTINSSFLTQKSRPSLEKFIKADNELKSSTSPSPPITAVAIKSSSTSKNDDNDDEKFNEKSVVPFKTKLEAILQRGPSHRSQRRPDTIELQRNNPLRSKTMIDISSRRNSKTNNKPIEDSSINILRPKSINSNTVLEYNTNTNTTNTNTNTNTDTNINDAGELLIINARKSLKPIPNGHGLMS